MAMGGTTDALTQPKFSATDTTRQVTPDTTCTDWLVLFPS